MTVFNLLHTVIIGPLELLFELLYSFAYQLSSNPGVSIVFLSLAMNFLVLPLYRQADAMQAEERAVEERLKPGVAHIKKTFSGDERFMLLQAFYRENHYKPTDALKGSMSLLLEIPFFLAAYNFLSGLELLQGVSFGPIRDLGAPDGLLALGGLQGNLLPFVMTGINLISGAVYTKGMSRKGKLQLYTMALIFLVFLYQSPSGLVFYWTLNNLFSLCKNLVYRLPNRQKLGRYCLWGGAGLLSVSGLAASGIILFSGKIPSLLLRLMIVTLVLAVQAPLLLMLWHKKHPRKKRALKLTRRDEVLFYSGCLFITVLTGILIPSAVIGSSPAEFLDFATRRSPLTSILHSTAIASGTFLLWLGIFYMLAKPAGKKKMSLGIWICSAVAIVNYMFFGTEYGNLSATLRYDSAPVFNLGPQFWNVLVVLALCGLGYMLWKKKAELVKMIYIVAGLSVVVMSAVNVNQIHSVASAAVDDLTASSQEEAPSFTLSRSGKNVVVIMMDRAISSYMPYMLTEKPELARQLAGFTYYPNTLSFGGSTNFGAPVLFGGYEYTPEEMNRRDEELLADKHNEAMKVMPAIFHDAGYRVTVCDPSYAGYSWIPDLSIYADYPDMQTYLTLGKFNLAQDHSKAAELLDRNLFCYSLFRTAPVIAQPTLYAHGTYNKLGDGGEQICTGLSQATGTSPVFENAYAVLQNFPAMTRVTDQPANTFMMISNDTAHSPTLLQTPDYVPASKVDNREYDAAHREMFKSGEHPLTMESEVQMKHYHANMAAMLQLGRWMDYLRENGVYDNTRIIIVADHGHFLGQREDMKRQKVDLMRFNPLLMVKDFGSTEFTTDHRFMTNGDVPTLALAGLVENPVNPFTGKPVNNDAKFAGPQHVILSGEWDITVNNGRRFIDSKWLSVENDIFRTENWQEWEPAK